MRMNYVSSHPNRTQCGKSDDMWSNIILGCRGQRLEGSAVQDEDEDEDKSGRVMCVNDEMVKR
jgi:hypothetical protein